MSQSTRSVVADGSTGRVETNAAAVGLANQSFTVSFWVKFSGAQAAALKTLVDYDHNTAPNKGWVVQSEDATAAGTWYLAYWNGIAFEPAGQFGAGKGVAIPADGAWHHVAYTKSGTTARGYLDGVAAWTPGAAVSATVNYDTTRKLALAGLATTGGRSTAAGLDDVSVFASALSSGQIAAIAAGTLNVNTLSPVFLWRLEEGTGTGTADSSGNGNAGTLIGGVSWSADVPVPLQGGVVSWWAWQRAYDLMGAG